MVSSTTTRPRRTNKSAWTLIIAFPTVALVLTAVFVVTQRDDDVGHHSDETSNGSAAKSSPTAAATSSRSAFGDDLCQFISSGTFDKLISSPREAEPLSKETLNGKELTCRVNKPQSSADRITISVELNDEDDDPTGAAHDTFERSCDQLPELIESDANVMPEEADVETLADTPTKDYDICGRIQNWSDDGRIRVTLRAVDDGDFLSLQYATDATQSTTVEKKALEFTDSVIRKRRG